MDGSKKYSADPRDPGRPGPPSDLDQAIYEKLKVLARYQMSSERVGITIQPTALVHEAYLRLLKDPTLSWDDDRQFYAAAGECMRRVLVDEARRRKALKRGGGQAKQTLLDVADQNGQHAIDPDSASSSILILDRALTALSDLDARLYEVVILRYFAGLSVDNTASVLGIAPRTVKRDWVAARAWLQSRLVGSATGDPR